METRSEKPLERKSNILVNIDDLRDGLLVVSFSHADNQYQGVLFQLNRERGIPSGISYPKEYLSGSESLDPDTVPPIYQRKSYFQELSPSSPSKPLLRRTIKPPARFKNGRAGLRLRSRPVLCAKCKDICNEKDEKPPLGSPVKIEPSKSPIDPKEFAFSIVGGKGILESYWRRPSIYETYPEELNYNTDCGIGPRRPGSLDPNGNILGQMDFDSCELNQDYAYPILPDGTVDSIRLPNGLPKKGKVKKSRRSVKRPASRRNLFVKRNPSPKPPSVDVGTWSRRANDETEGPGEEDSRSMSSPTEKPDETENGEKWENRFRKKCLVPARFRDSSMVTKNIFKFKKRRANETVVNEEEEEVNQGRRSSDSNVRVLTPPPPIKGPFLPVDPLETEKAPNGLEDGEPKRSIKITLKSLGLNRIIVVPPKEEDGRNEVELEPKAVRKAMKKAKKEKRRRHKSSQNPDFVDSALPMMPTLTPRPTHFNPPSPFPPVLDPQF